MTSLPNIPRGWERDSDKLRLSFRPFWSLNLVRDFVSIELFLSHLLVFIYHSFHSTISVEMKSVCLGIFQLLNHSLRQSYRSNPHSMISEAEHMSSPILQNNTECQTKTRQKAIKNEKTFISMRGFMESFFDVTHWPRLESGRQTGRLALVRIDANFIMF